MASNGIRDRVAIVGMGCTNFGERWDKSMGDLLVDAATEAVASAHLDIKDVDAFWFGTLFSGNSGLTLSRPLKLGQRRDTIGRVYLTAVNPISNPRLDASGSLTFENPAVGEKRHSQ